MTTSNSTMGKVTAATLICAGVGFLVGMWLLPGTFGLEQWAWMAIGSVVGGLVGWVIGKVLFRQD